MVGNRDLVLGTAGHIDHGKTALVRALTGVDTDRLPDEKARGITIDLGFASLDVGGHRLAIVDVPGHERFVRNMLAGASGLDLAMLLVAADDSVMPQTREHLEILRLLGLAGGLIVLSKCDLSDPTWLELVEDDVRRLVAGTFLEGAPIVRTSAHSGEGIDRLKTELATLCATAPAREDPGLFRMAIDRSFTVAGHGTVVTGTIASGSVAVGDELEWQPAGRLVRVRGLQRHDRAVERIGRGARAAVNLVGVHHAEVRRGQELAAPGYLRATRMLSVEVRAADEMPRPIRHRARYRLHVGTAEVAATLALLEQSELGPGESGLGQLYSQEPIVAVYNQPFVLREESPAATLGGGRVLQSEPGRIRRRETATIGRLRALVSSDPAVRLTACLAFQGLAAQSEQALCRMTGLVPGQIAEVRDALTASGAIVPLPASSRRTMLVEQGVAAALEERLLRALARLHDAQPRASAIRRAHLAAALPDLENDALLAALIERLRAKGKVVCAPRTIALAGFEPKLSQAERRLKKELAEAIRAGGFSPPELDELSAGARQRSVVVRELLDLLCAEEQAVAVGPGLYLDVETESELRRRVTERLADGATMTMAELRDLLSTSRKYAVPIGEYLDRIGLTERAGDVRVLRTSRP